MRRPNRLSLVGTALVVSMLFTGCSTRRGSMPVDAAGLTQEDVATMSLHEEFDAYRQRYHHMQELLAGAQRAVNDGPWDWTGSDRGTEVGGDGVAPLAGSDAVNSYFLRTDRIWEPPGATGDARDLQPMIDYFDEQGWRHREGHPGRDHDTWAKTDDGWQIEYVVQPNGRYVLTVLQRTLLDQRRRRALRGGRWPQRRRPPGGVPARRVPAVPVWDDPIVSPPKI